MDLNTKTNKTLVFLVLDRSGSMASTQEETISGVNTYMAKLKEDTVGVYRATLVQFDAHGGPQMLLSYENKPVSEVVPLTTSTYEPRGLTPLYDAIGEGVRMAKPDADESVTMVVVTDGMENASREFRLDTVKNLIAAKEKEGWTFVFLGANIDAYAVSGSMGVPSANTSNYRPAAAGVMYQAVAQSTMARTQSNATVGVGGSRLMSFFSPEQQEEMGGDDPSTTSTYTPSTMTGGSDPATWTTTTPSIHTTGGGPAAGTPFPCKKAPRPRMVRKPGGKWSVTVPDGK